MSINNMADGKNLGGSDSGAIYVWVPEIMWWKEIQFVLMRLV
jgi:hypothetical protein